MRVNGSCHCGAISIEAQVDAAQVAICHCADCQVLSGSPFRTVAFTTREAMIVRGEPRTYVKLADSGRRRAQCFCPDCGTPLFSADGDSAGGLVTLRTGFLDQRRQLIPRLQIWRCSAEPWVDEIGAIAAFDRQEPMDARRPDSAAGPAET